ncbi:hypothetical protein EFO90_09930 [Lactiplantibacillus plantarum]|uniref:hypothetical protein n=1 Tax=Lactiplantibacillus plantarum TaxID=1590 RepID=UPI0021A78750|nr:hypothetical protein [Lactiplantibacillus plantarum]MCT3214672.1 hypothetical protein [Lactiplantibacillus plantarum]MCT3272330.1 hypothetical protein [Lactiplantibacillus plantarum]
MNYLLQLKAFYDQLEISPLNSSEIALWHALMSINNKSAWSDTFTVASSVLCQKAGLKSRNFFKTRNALQQAGYIEWSQRKGNQAAEYHLNVLYEPLHANSARSSSHNSADSSSYSSARSSSPLNKHKQNKTNDKKTKRTYAENSDEYKLASYLVARIRTNNAEFKTPNLQNWSNDIRLMIERDGHTAKQIRNMIDWCQADDFWFANILSAKKLRSKYETMRAQALRDTRPKQKKSNIQPIETQQSTFDDAIYNAYLNNDEDVEAVIKQYSLDGIELSAERIGVIVDDRARKQHRA